jgi:hypothetical protein
MGKATILLRVQHEIDKFPINRFTRDDAEGFA